MRAQAGSEGKAEQKEAAPPTTVDKPADEPAPTAGEEKADATKGASPASEAGGKVEAAAEPDAGKPAAETAASAASEKTYHAAWSAEGEPNGDDGSPLKVAAPTYRRPP